MPMAARNTDKILTGHPCDVTSTIVATKAVKVFIQGQMAAVTADAIAPHTILAGTSCVAHLPTAVTGPGSSKVFCGGFPANRVGDVADMGAIISGSTKVIIGG